MSKVIENIRKEKKYPSIPHLPNSEMGRNDKGIHRGMADYCECKYRKNTQVIVTEKVDGSNVSILNKDGEFFALSRAGYYCEGSDYDQHKLWYEKVEQYKSDGLLNNNILPIGDRVVFESLTVPHGTRYKKAPDYLLIDWKTNNGRRLWNTYNSFLDIKKVQTLYYGDIPMSVDNIRNVMPKKGMYGAKEGYEGLVYRIEREGKFDFLAKWVRHDYETLKYFNQEERE